MDKIKALFESRRFWTAVIGLVVVVSHDTLGLPEEAVQDIAWVVAAWIVGDSLRET